jgi:hypothetical protein
MNTRRMSYLLVAVLVAATTLVGGCVPLPPASAPTQPPATTQAPAAAPTQAPAPARAPATPVTATNPAAPTGSQFLPNVNQQITPLAPEGATFESLNPDLADKPGLAGGASGQQRGQSG